MRKVMQSKEARKKLKTIKKQVYKIVDEFTKELLIEENMQALELSFFHESVAPAVKAVLICVMNHSDGNQSKAARVLGISRSTLRHYLFKYFGTLAINEYKNKL